MGPVLKRGTLVCNFRSLTRRATFWDDIVIEAQLCRTFVFSTRRYGVTKHLLPISVRFASWAHITNGNSKQRYAPYGAVCIIMARETVSFSTRARPSFLHGTGWCISTSREKYAHKIQIGPRLIWSLETLRKQNHQRKKQQLNVGKKRSSTCT